ncbi:unnamed protein product [Prunus armeniaca]|uniref:Uncharacterized protein n=1 Tax=Prunus armeniaca TaxID=36596 RepID=A0A6J5WID2_PRUAR|nr:unnamed protein product [Prunus armeniaca]
MTLSAHFTDSTSYTYAESCEEPEMHKGSFVTSDRAIFSLNFCILDGSDTSPFQAPVVEV